MEWVTTEQQSQMLAAEIHINNVVIEVIKDCEQCNRSTRACEQHRALTDATNRASEAIEQAIRELRKLGK